MPSDYPLEDLGHENFERLAVAMARRLTGPGLQSFGRGPDGGREASFVGTIRFGTQTTQKLRLGMATRSFRQSIERRRCPYPATATA